jgi:hypothetical protein
MSYSPVATIDGIEFHPQASNVGIVTDYSKFLENIPNPELSATIWRRALRRQEYIDVFNNASGARDLIHDVNENILTASIIPHSNGLLRYLYKSKESGKVIDLKEGRFIDFFDHAPFLKDDIEFAVRNLLTKNHNAIIIQFLNEYPDQRRQNPNNETHYFHIDKRPTFYIQIGGAGLEFTNAIANYRMKPTIPVGFGEDDLSTIHIAPSIDENNVKPNEIGTLKPADLMHFNGWASGRALVHRAPLESAVKREGRLAISIYPA